MVLTPFTCTLKALSVYIYPLIGIYYLLNTIQGFMLHVKSVEYPKATFKLVCFNNAKKTVKQVRYKTGMVIY